MFLFVILLFFLVINELITESNMYFNLLISVDISLSLMEASEKTTYRVGNISFNYYSNFLILKIFGFVVNFLNYAWLLAKMI